MIRSLGLMTLVLLSHADVMNECRSKQTPLPHDQETCADDTASVNELKNVQQQMEDSDENGLLQARANLNIESGSRQEHGESHGDHKYIANPHIPILQKFFGNATLPPHLPAVMKRLESTFIRGFKGQIKATYAGNYTKALKPLYPSGFPKALDNNSDGSISEPEALHGDRVMVWHLRFLYETHKSDTENHTLIGPATKVIQYGEVFDENGDGHISEVEMISNFGEWLAYKAMYEMSENPNVLVTKSANASKLANFAELNAEVNTKSGFDKPAWGKGANFAESGGEVNTNLTLIKGGRAAWGAVTLPNSRNTLASIWVSKQLAKLENQICGSHNFPIQFHELTDWRPWVNRCPSGYNDWGFVCAGCKGAKEVAGICWERCGRQNRIPLPETCSLFGTAHYCVADSSACTEKMLTLVVNVALMAASVIPQGKSMSTAIKASVKAAKKTTSKALKKKLMRQASMEYKKAVWQQMGELYAAAKVKLAVYMIDKRGQNVPTNIQEEINRDGVTLFVAKEQLKMAGLDKDVGEAIKEVVSQVDPTGIYDIVQTFNGGPKCKDIKLDEFPSEHVWVEPEHPVEYKEITSDLKCCRQYDINHLGTETGDNVETPYRCELSCKKKKDCLFFSHNAGQKKCTLCKWCANIENDGWNSWKTPRRLRTCSGHNFYDWFEARDGSLITLGDTVSFYGFRPNSWWPRDANYRTKYCPNNAKSPYSRYTVCAQHECYRDQTFTCSGVFAELKTTCPVLTERSKYRIALKEYTGGECKNSGHYGHFSFNAFSCVWYHSKLQCAQAKCCSCVTRVALNKKRMEEQRKAMEAAGIELPIRLHGMMR
jgi:hypothetical protein